MRYPEQKWLTVREACVMTWLLTVIVVSLTKCTILYL